MTLTAKPASFTPRALAAYGKCGSRIRVLCLQGIEYLTGDDFWRFISAFPSLRSLRCQDITIEQPGVLRILTQLGYRRPRKLKLDNLEVAGALADDAIAVLLESCSCLSSLESLSLDVSQTERFIAFVSQLPALRRLTLEFELGVVGMIVRSIWQLMDVLKLFREWPISGNAFQFILQISITFPSNLNHQLTEGDAPGLCQALEEQLLCIPHLRHVIFHFRGLRANRQQFWMVELSQHFPQLRQSSLFGVHADKVTAIGHDNTTPRYCDEDTHASVFRSVVSAMAVSQDNEWMASGSIDTTIIIWCLKERRAARQWVAHTAPVACLAFSPDGQKLMSGGRLDSGITIWDVSLPQGVQKIVALNCPGSSPAACVWYPARSDRESLVACAFPWQDGKIRVWDVHTLQLRYTFRPAGGTSCFITFSPDGRWLAIEGRHGSCSVRDTATGALHTVLQDAGLSIHTAVFDPSGKRITTTSGKGSNAMVQLWDVEAGTRLLSFGDGLHGPLGGLNVSFSPDGRTVLSMGERPTIWDAATGKAIRVFQGPGCMDIVYCLCFSPDGRYVAATSYDGVVTLWRVHDGACIATLSGHNPSIAHHVGFSAKAETVFYTCDDGTVYMYQLSDIARSPAY
ncbi:hypothetical protein GSI_02290 [Ganoderma sinense ZZ0214-1]|uniref:Uncharacterized protein n=1 Tax=Ganoderma sinense ZZ0214-1 TaxID=1077348 RepID=A0A2G8SP86_9APHY|nr:hypothetical protein GSI_02290 [Ganoderma sinense ZZ0214-1]